MTNNSKTAPGAPGISPRWTSSSKSGIGKSMNAASQVTFTLSHGIVNEVYFPREDIACIRDMELIVTGDNDFFSEEKRDTHHNIKWIKDGVPAFHIVNKCLKKKYIIEKEIITDPHRDTLLQRIRFRRTSKNKPNPYNLFVLLAPHIHNKGEGNIGWIDEYKGVPMLFAKRKDTTIALACSRGFLKRSIGFAGYSDGYTDLKEHGQMQGEYSKADDGNIALTAQIDITDNTGFLLALGFGKTATEAGNNAWASILGGFDFAQKAYVHDWDQWQKSLRNIKSNDNSIGKNFRISAAVLRTNESKRFPGGIVASLSIPWGESKGDDDTAGYHVIWPRDLVESAGGFLALKSKEDVLRILNYLMSVQDADGKWSQNMWMGGDPYWTGIQMDQVALPLVLIESCYKYLSEERRLLYWPKVKKAIAFLLLHGPSTKQDRWEEESGLTTFTLAAEIAGLLAGAELAGKNNEKTIATLCRETADYWNEKIEEWTYVTDTATCKEVGVDGYYMRINPYQSDASGIKNKIINLKNHKDDEGKMPLNQLISVDALSLVRFGLRAADDPRILNTMKVIDAKLKVDTPSGACWYRYNNDGYGEDKDGNPYDKHGIGRAWPLLTGERGHYEIAAGNFEMAKKLLKSMDAFANHGLLSEQIWDTDDIPGKELFFGKPSGSAMPLTWTHAEYIKLCCSIKDKKVTDMPSYTRDRYILKTTVSTCITWRFDWQLKKIDASKTLRIQLEESAIVRWTDDDWKTTKETPTKNTGLTIYIADITSQKEHSSEIQFTFFWKESNKWEDKNFSVEVISNKTE